MKTMIIFGGSGGLGQELIKAFRSEYKIWCPRSKEIDIRHPFITTTQPDIVLNFAGVNVNGFIHKLDLDSILNMLDVNVKGTINVLRGIFQQ